MIKHTPGPWRVEDRAHHGNLDICTDEDEPWFIAIVLHGVGYHGQADDKPNAQLTAAAPELLDALKSLLIICANDDTPTQAQFKTAYDAIAKAEGQPSPTAAAQT